MITDKLVKQVRLEARKLRDNATAEEKKSLDFDNLDGTSTKYCMYGQLGGGDCRSERAVELLDKCAVPISFTNADWFYRPVTDPKSIDTFEPQTKPDPHGYGTNTIWVFSPIEVFITQEEIRIKHREYEQQLVDYIKGKRKTLQFRGIQNITTNPGDLDDTNLC